MASNPTAATEPFTASGSGNYNDYGVVMLKRFILWFLSLIGLCREAAQVDAAIQAGQQYDSQQAQEINQEADNEIQDLSTQSDAELDATILQLQSDAKAHNDPDSSG